MYWPPLYEAVLFLNECNVAQPKMAVLHKLVGLKNNVIWDANMALYQFWCLLVCVNFLYFYT